MRSPRATAVSGSLTHSPIRWQHQAHQTLGLYPYRVVCATAGPRRGVKGQVEGLMRLQASGSRPSAASATWRPGRCGTWSPAGCWCLPARLATCPGSATSAGTCAWRSWRRARLPVAPGGPRHHRGWQPSQVQIAAAGGADRRSAQDRGRAVESIARCAPYGAAAPLPRGDERSRGLVGYATAGAGNAVGIDVGVAASELGRVRPVAR
jgi:hypothetical protein